MERVTLSFFAICIIIFVVATEGKYTVVKRVGYRLGIPRMGVRIPKMIDIFFLLLFLSPLLSPLQRTDFEYVCIGTSLKQKKI